MSEYRGKMILLSLCLSPNLELVKLLGRCPPTYECDLSGSKLIKRSGEVYDLTSGERAGLIEFDAC